MRSQGSNFAFKSALAAGDLRDCLRHIYSALYVELVVKSAMHEPGRPFQSEAFVQAVKKWLERCAASST